MCVYFHTTSSEDNKFFMDTYLSQFLTLMLKLIIPKVDSWVRNTISVRHLTQYYSSCKRSVVQYYMWDFIRVFNETPIWHISYVEWKGEIKLIYRFRKKVYCFTVSFQLICIRRSLVFFKQYSFTQKSVVRNNHSALNAANKGTILYLKPRRLTKSVPLFWRHLWKNNEVRD
jgi:hypothetical protein